MITTITRAEFSGRPSLHVWIVHNEGDASVMDEGHELLRKMAHNAGVSRITFGSPRVGWAKRYKLVSATYEIDL